MALIGVKIALIGVKTALIGVKIGSKRGNETEKRGFAQFRLAVNLHLWPSSNLPHLEFTSPCPVTTPPHSNHARSVVTEA